jgi:pimeloyl-ACP methyl ester carboxylesterase
MLALAAAAEAPARVDAVVLEDPPFRTMGDRIAHSPLLSYFRAVQPLAGSPLTVAALSRTLASLLVEAADGSIVPLSTLRDASSLRFLASCLRRVDPRVLEPIVAGEWLDGYDWRKCAAALPCPALVIQCDPAQGGMLTNEDAAALDSLIPDCTLVRLNGVGHQAHWQDAGAVSRHVLAFAASLTAEEPNA